MPRSKKSDQAFQKNIRIYYDFLAQKSRIVFLILKSGTALRITLLFI